MDIGLNGTNWPVHDQAYADRCRKVEYNVTAVHQFRDQRSVKHRIDGIGEAGTAFQVENVVKGTRGKIIHNGDSPVLIQTSFGEVRTDKSCTAGDQHVHRVPSDRDFNLFIARSHETRSYEPDLEPSAFRSGNRLSTR